MDMIKLVKGDRVIERRKVDYENNINIWNLRGWKLDDGKPKAPPKPKPTPKPEPKAEKPKEEPKKDNEWVKEETLVRPTIKENESAENFQERLKNYEEAVSKKTKSKKAE